MKKKYTRADIGSAIKNILLVIALWRLVFMGLLKKSMIIQLN